MRIVIDENLMVTPVLEGLGAELISLPGRDIDAEALADVDALLVRSVTRVDRALLEPNRLRFVGTATAGTEHIDRAYLEQAGIPFAAAPGSNANAVVEYVLTVLASAGRLASVMAGASFGIVGYGHVGQRLAEVISGLGGCVRVYDPWVSVPELMRAADLKDVLGCSVISLHAALHDQAPFPSRGMIGGILARTVAPETLFINAGRGGLVTVEGINALLDQGCKLVLDTWPEEPHIDQQLLQRVWRGTPHIAGYSVEAKARATDILVAALEAVLEDSISQSSLRSPRGLGEYVTAAKIEPIECHYRGDLSDWVGRLLEGVSTIDRNHGDLCHGVTGDGVPGVEFDRLRRDYRLRRELRGQRVVIGQRRDESLVEAANAIGVTLI